MLWSLIWWMKWKRHGKRWKSFEGLGFWKLFFALSAFLLISLSHFFRSIDGSRRGRKFLRESHTKFALFISSSSNFRGPDPPPSWGSGLIQSQRRVFLGDRLRTDVRSTFSVHPVARKTSLRLRRVGVVSQNDGHSKKRLLSPTEKVRGQLRHRIRILEANCLNNDAPSAAPSYHRMLLYLGLESGNGRPVY